MNASRIVRGLVPLVAAGMVAASPLLAQRQPGEWTAIPTFGAIIYDNATPFKNTGFVGGEAHYNFNEHLSFGISLAFARPVVDGSYFPLAVFRVAADTLLLTEVGQQSTQANYAGLVTLTMPFGQSAGVYAQAGLGGYTFFFDRQSMNEVILETGDAHFSGLLVPVGAGVRFNVGAQTGMRIEARNDIFMRFDRDQFNPTAERFQNFCSHHQRGARGGSASWCMEDANGNPPDMKDTNHNLRVNIGFEFSPRLR